ncbi:unnamed protein product [Linum trigynum]|uniref:Uncharacterized protein n=1 Tax=Linum trigynum TaxID=586398 RepID=A0AAV2D7U5_9ROSI
MKELSVSNKKLVQQTRKTVSTPPKIPNQGKPSGSNPSPNNETDKLRMDRVQGKDAKTGHQSKMKMSNSSTEASGSSNQRKDIPENGCNLPRKIDFSSTLGKGLMVPENAQHSTASTTEQADSDETAMAVDKGA